MTCGTPSRISGARPRRFAATTSARRGVWRMRRAHAVELAALREALDDAIAETARANMERDVARLKRLDEDEAEQASAPDAPLSPRAPSSTRSENGNEKRHRTPRTL